MPGIGRKTAQRLSFYILSLPKEEAKKFSEAINEAVEKIHRCALCCNLTEDELCPICSSDLRDKTTICVVEDSQDLLAIEKTGTYKGVYHVLHGVISPMDGITPNDIRPGNFVNSLISLPIGSINTFMTDVTASRPRRRTRPFSPRAFSRLVRTRCSGRQRSGLPAFQRRPDRPPRVRW